MLRRKVLVLVTVFVLVTQLLLATGVVNSIFAFGPVPGIAVNLHFDLDTAQGFEVRTLDPPFSGTPEFVLRQGTIGTFNITLTSSETNRTVIAALGYGGDPPFSSAWSAGRNVPDGVTYMVEPSNMTLAPNSTATATMHISAAPSMTIRSYKLSITLHLEDTINENRSELRGYSTLLTIIEGNSPINITSTTKGTTSYVTQTATRTSITTVTTLIEVVTEPAIYAWAIGATGITAVLAVVILRRRS